MKILILLAISLSITSCATQKFQFEPNKNLWIGRTSDDLASHPVFASMQLDTRKTDSGIETRTFKNKAGVSSSASCSGAGCDGFAVEITCNHVFLLKKDVIADYNRVGSCAEESLNLRPLKQDGSPTFTKSEIERYNNPERDIASDGPKRNCSFLGRILKAQGC